MGGDLKGGLEAGEGEGGYVPGETLEIQPMGRGITQALKGSLGRL